MIEQTSHNGIFVSYARADLPFAQWTAQSLASHGLVCWIDAQELTPGSDWSAAINAAIDFCGALLVIGSAESLSSPHCRREWRRAKAAGKSIVLAVIEAVRVPDELAGCPMVDMRAWNRPPWPALAAAFHTGRATPPGSLKELRIPKPIAIAALGLLLLFVFQGLFVVVWLVDVSGSFAILNPWSKALLVGHLAILLGWVGWTTRWAWRLMHRNGTVGGLLGMILVPCVWLLHTIVGGQIWEIWTAICLMLAMYGLVYWAMGLSLGAWLPLRPHRYVLRAYEAMQSVEAGEQRSGVLPKPGTARSYSLYFAPHDARVAARFVAVMGGWGYQRVGAEEPQALRLLLLSNATPVDFAPLVGDTPRDFPTVCVLLSAIAIPQEREALQRYQWVDYRRGEDREIEMIAEWLSKGTPVGALPEIRPPTVTTLPFGPLLASIVLTVFASLLMFDVMLNLLGTIASVRDYYARPVSLDLTELANALVAAVTAAMLRGRLVTFLQYQIGFFVIFALLIAYAAMDNADSGGFVFVIVGTLVIEVLTAQGIRNWLPVRRIHWRQLPTLATQPAWRFVRRQVLILVLAAVAAAVMWTSSDAARWGNLK
jgi:hypothetical protein